MKFILINLLLFPTISTLAQDTLPMRQYEEKKRLSVSGYIESYYCYDFNKPWDSKRPTFFYNHNRHNEFNLNLGVIKASYSDEKIRGNLGLAAGTYMNANYSAEPGVLKNIFEANTGFRLGESNLWLDAGIFPSHIGWEAAIGKDNWTLTRSIVAENSPYYEAGAKMTFTSKNNKWIASVMALNGFQRIKRIDGNSLMSFGTQLTYKPKDGTIFNYSSFVGSDKPDSVRQVRLYHDFYGTFSISKNILVTAGFDVATEQRAQNDARWNFLCAPVLIAKFLFTKKWTSTIRGEYYHDKSGILIPTVTPNGFQVSGVSLNVDYTVSSNMLVRVEARNVRSRDPYFIKGNDSRHSNTFVTTAFSYSF